MLHEFAARGSIARTAEALGYTPSAVSQQLAVLEKEAGTPLLDRTARSAGLTDAGKRLAIHAERILAMVEAAEADLSAQAAQPSGRVVVTAFPSAAVAFAPALARSLKEHPQLSLLLREAEPDDGLQLVRSGEVEVAIVDDWTGRMSADLEAADAGHGVLSYYHLVRDPLILVVARDHPAADPERPVDLRALRNESWLAAPVGEPSRQAADRLLAAVGLTPPLRRSSRASARSPTWSPAASASPSCRGSRSAPTSGGSWSASCRPALTWPETCSRWPAPRP